MIYLRKTKNQITCILAVIGLAFSAVIPSFATSVSQVQEEKKDLEDGLEEVQEIIDGLESKKSDMESYLKELDVNLASISSKLAQVKNSLENKQNELELTKQQLDEAKITETKQYDDMKKRIKYMYENGNSTYLELLLESENFADMLNKADYIKQVSEYDRSMLENYQTTKKIIEEKELQIQQECESIEALKKQSEKQKKSVEELIGVKKTEMKEYQTQLQKSEKMAADYEAEIAEQEALIKRLEAAAAERKRKEAAKKAAAAAANASSSPSANKTTSENTPVVNASGFVWPCPSSRKISSDFGYRIDPINKTNKMHNGIDVSAPTGTLIVAAASGTVVATAYNSSMGNYVMIDHGDDLYTIYMHCSGFATSAGTSVKAGESIAYVGSTGRSTGPHLHFSVRTGGTYVNPWRYVS